MRIGIHSNDDWQCTLIMLKSVCTIVHALLINIDSIHVYLTFYTKVYRDSHSVVIVRLNVYNTFYQLPVLKRIYCEIVCIYVSAYVSSGNEVYTRSNLEKT